ncbi:hypothetical protein [Pseudomonas sp.]|uniref:hypothetical protein n=1 Tax=Pseudomonas sp. TaxID=306 RepID=UPI003F2BF454
MASWSRNTLWRQGQLLQQETAQLLGLISTESPDRTAVVVISHDCDLAQLPGAEPFVEVIIGRFVDLPADGSYTNCKNLRRLQIECSSGKSPQLLELETTSRKLLLKENLGNPEQALCKYSPCEDHRMSPSERNILQLWLAARYRRAAFPDEFDRRLKEVTDVSARLSKAFKSSGRHIPAVFFDVDEGTENQRIGPDDPYVLTVFLLYSTDRDPQAAEKAALETASKIIEIFNARCTILKNGIVVWQWIELEKVEVISDQALTYADSLQMMKWQADHISLRADPKQDVLQN